MSPGGTMKLAACAAALVAATAPFSSYALTTTRTVAAGSAPGPAAIDPVTKRVFVANTGFRGTSGGFTVVEPDGTATSFAASQPPTSVAVSPGLRRAVYSSFGVTGSTVTIFDTDT